MDEAEASQTRSIVIFRFKPISTKLKILGTRFWSARDSHDLMTLMTFIMKETVTKKITALLE